MRRSIAIVVEELIRLEKLPDCTDPEHHPVIPTLDLTKRQDLYKAAYFAIYDKDVNAGKSTTYIMIITISSRKKTRR